MFKNAHLIFILFIATVTSCSHAPSLNRELVEDRVAKSDSWKPTGLNTIVWQDAVKAWECAILSGESSSSKIGIIDYSQSSEAKRFWIVDLEEGKTLYRTRVAHGSGSGVEYARSFSNVSGSYKTSLGLFRVGEFYYGKHGGSRRLDGLEESNDNARSRAIVLHSANYVSNSYVNERGMAGRSQGCPALPPDVASEIMDTLDEGDLILAWHSNKSWRDSSPWLNCSN